MIKFLLLPETFIIPNNLKNDSHPDIIKIIKNLISALQTYGIIYEKDDEDIDTNEAWNEIYYDYKSIFKKYQIAINLYLPDYIPRIIVNLTKFRLMKMRK